MALCRDEKLWLFKNILNNILKEYILNLKVQSMFMNHLLLVFNYYTHSNYIRHNQKE